MKTELQNLSEHAAPPGENLKVLFYLYFPAGGIGRYTAMLMPALSALGVSVEAAVVPEFEWKDSPGFHCWPGLRSISHKNVLRRKARFLMGQFVNPRRLAARARETKPDIIHICNINHLSYPAWERAFPKDGPLLAATVHDVRRQKSILFKPWEAWQLRRFYRRADVLYVHSQTQCQELIEFAEIPEEKICVVPHGPYTYTDATESRMATRARLGIPAEVNLGLSFGLIRDEKNIDQLIQALPQQVDRVHLLIAGNNTSGHRPISFYETLAERIGVSSRVHFKRGFVPEAEVGNLFQASDWLALTYTKSFTSQSGVLSSAVQYRLPILATPTATFAETMQVFHLGILCADDGAAAIADGIAAMLNQLEGRAVEFDFDSYLACNSWERNASLTIERYKKLCRR